MNTIAPINEVPVGDKEISSSSFKMILKNAWFYRIWVIYFLPAMIVLGVFNNIAILTLMKRAEINIGKKFKRYYTLIAFFDLSAIISIDLIESYLEDGLSLTTDGKFFISTKTYSAWSCKLISAWWVVSTTISNYTLAALCVERMVAICFPLRAKSLMTGKWRLGQWCLLILPGFLLVLPMALYFHDVVQIAEDKFICSPANPTSPLFFVYAWSGCFLAFFFHGCIMLVCSLLITAKLILEGAKKSKLAINGKRNTSKEMHAALTVVILAILQCCSYFPTTVFCMIFCLAMGNIKFRQENPDSFAGIALAYDMVVVTFSVAHCWNFYLYLVRIPSFRKLFLKRFCFISTSSSDSYRAHYNVHYHKCSNGNRAF